MKVASVDPPEWCAIRWPMIVNLEDSRAGPGQLPPPKGAAKIHRPDEPAIRIRVDGAPLGN